MTIEGKIIEHPLQAKTSFFKVIDSVKMLAEDNDKAFAAYAKKLLKEIEQYPELSDGFEDPELLVKYKEQINKLLRLLFPDALLLNEIKAICGPFDFKPFYTSTRLKNILNNAGEDFTFVLADMDEEMMYKFGCIIVLNSHFQFPMDVGKPLMYDIPNKNTGITRTYRMAYNADLMEVLPTERSLEVTYEDYLKLLDNFDDIALWKEKFPPGSWILRGIGVINLMDVTMEDSLANITESLLTKSNNSFEKITMNIKNILNNSKLDIGVLKYDNGKIFPATSSKAKMKSLMLKGNENFKCDESMCTYSYDQLINQSEPIIISDIDKFDEVASTPMSKMLRAKKYKSYLIAPLIHEGEILSFLEIGSKKKYEINSATLIKIDTVFPILAMAVSRFKIEEQNLIEAIIQQECTSIHPSVKWKFEEEANKFIQKKATKDDPQFKDIIFNNVYPMYGQMDIKSSSTIRNKGVQSDLVKQINAVNKVLKKAYQITNMAVYDELIFRMNSYKEAILDGLSAGSEHKTLEFIRQEINPVFKHLRKEHKELKPHIEKYSKILDPDLKVVYEMRKRFDESVQKINFTLSGFLDQKQEEAQNIFPHYFERYKTDGVEYNIYIGDSMSQHKSFNPIYLRNLRLWQLITMCEMELEFFNLRKKLSTPLEIASLILVYNTPLSIHFRIDEKRFDVEGAYNARYEIVKKRVDKAHIKGTDERITIPGKIAVIYSNEEDARSYRLYIKYLEEKNLIIPGSMEELEVEDLQGITGLKALRFEMDYKSKTSKKETLSIDKVIEELERTN